MVFQNLLDMIVDSPDINTIQLRHQSLRLPYILVLIAQFHIPSLVANSANEGQVFSGCAADGYIVFDILWIDAFLLCVHVIITVSF